MRILEIAVLAAALVMPAIAAQAADRQFAHPPVSRTLPDLGPVGDGRRLWVEFNCYLCHGPNGGGQFGPNIQHAEAGDLNEAVKQGIPEAGMPSYGKYVNATDLKDLVAYLNSVGTKKEPTWWDWWEPNPTQ